MGANPKDKGEEKTRRRPGRVPTSCMECRRLKLRCDRNVPCGKCVQKGCGSICPDGSLTPGKGNRMVLANTEELHERIETLCTRIRELEDALSSLQATVSEETHPLLRTDVLHLNTPRNQTSTTGGPMLSESWLLPSRAPTNQATQSGSPDPAFTQLEDNFVDAFGTLTIGSRGEGNFLGKTARSEYLIRAFSKPRPESTLVFPRVSRKIIEASCPEISGVDPALVEEIFSLLPPLSEAIRLCEIYLENGKFMYTPILRTELFDEVLTIVYRADSFVKCPSNHALSLLLIVFAIATLFDSSRPPFSVDAQEYYYLARTALGVNPPVLETTLMAIQTMTHLACYLELSDWESAGSNAGWVYIGLALRLANSIGLHLDSARWALCSEFAERRSRVFWQIFELDTWVSFGFGRPTSVSLAYVDCALPKDYDEIVDENGQKQMGFHMWSLQWTKLMHHVMGTAFGVKLPLYSVIIDLDRQIRDFPVPSHLRPHCGLVERTPPSPAVIMQRFLTLSHKETTLLNLHRSYFAQALQDQPSDLLKHKYGPSVLATYRSAWRLVKGLNFTWTEIPHLLARVSLAWSQALSAAIVFCLLVTRAPCSTLTMSSLEELDTVAEMFVAAAPTCRTASNNLESIQNLRKKAHEVLDHHHSHSQDTTLTPAELDRLGGKTHLISAFPQEQDPVVPVQRSTNSSSPGSTSGSSSGSGSTPNLTMASMPTHTNGNGEDIHMHPTIVEDMRAFGAPAFNPDNDFEFPHELDFTAISDYNYGSVNSAQPTTQTQMFGFATNPNTQAPVLDATWQSFVEQLGF